MKSALVVPVFNRKKTTLQFLQSFYSDSEDIVSVIIVDSGSTDGTQESISGLYPGIILLQTDSSDWWSAATNKGIRYAETNGFDHVITCNDDNLISRKAIVQLIESAIQSPGAIIAATVCYRENPDTVMFAGRIQSGVTDRFFYLDNGKKYDDMRKELREVDLLHGMCTLFPMSVFREAGYFDEITFPHLFADSDLELRARKIGYHLLVDTRAVIFNDHTQTGISPYSTRTGPNELYLILTSRKSVFQLSTRTRFLWRHRRSVFSFLITWLGDYCRLIIVIILRWFMPEETLNKYGRLWSGFMMKK